MPNFIIMHVIYENAFQCSHYRSSVDSSLADLTLCVHMLMGLRPQMLMAHLHTCDELRPRPPATFLILHGVLGESRTRGVAC